jgi:hypothetical protein
MLSPVVVAGAFVALACWVLTVVKVRDVIRDPRNRPLRYLTATLVSLSLAMSLQPLAQWLDHVTGILDLGRVTGNAFTIVAAASAQVVLLHLARPQDEIRQQARRRIMLMALTVALIVVLFLFTPAPYSVSDPYVVSHAYYYDTPTAAGAPYQFVVIAYLGWASAEGIWRSRRYASVASRPTLRAGMLLIGCGCLFILAYIALKLVTILFAVSESGLVTYLQNRVLVPTYTAASLVILTGATLPSWGPKVGLERLWDAIVACRQCRQLYPLWTLVGSAVPHVVMLPHPAQPVLKRARMTVEILDGYVQLSRWTSGEAVECARHHAASRVASGSARDAAIEAAVMAVAARDARTGRQPVDDPDRTLLPDALATDGAGGAQMTRLIRVANALRRSPVVTATLNDTT